MTSSNWYFVIIAVIWAGVSGFYAGAARVHGELIWLEIVQGKSKEQCPGSRSHYVWIYPLRVFLFWPLMQLLSSYRRDEERRRRSGAA